MILKATLLGKTYAFDSVKEVLAKANEPKSGDTLAGIAAADAKERIAAKAVLSQLTVADITEHPAVPYEADAVTRIILDDHCRPAGVGVRQRPHRCGTVGSGAWLEQ
mgnify:CR=1 FL=1